MLNNNNNKHESIYIEGLAYVLVLEVKRNILRWGRRRRRLLRRAVIKEYKHMYVYLSVWVCVIVCACA